jgi:hypothetical protein
LKNTIFQYPELYFSKKVIINSLDAVVNNLKTKLPIFFCGGSSLFTGLEERILKLYKDDYKIQFFKSRSLSSYIGTEMISSLNSFQDRFIMQEDFNENNIDKLIN